MNRKSSVSAENSLTNTWRDSISTEYRHHMARIFSQAMLPNNVAILAKIVESEIFEKADSKQEYCQLMFDKIFKVQEESNEKDEKRRGKRMQNRPAILHHRYALQRGRITTSTIRKTIKKIPVRKGHHIVAHQENCRPTDCPLSSHLKQTLDELKELKEKFDKVLAPLNAPADN